MTTADGKTTLPLNRSTQAMTLGQRDGYAAAIALSTAGVCPPLMTAVNAAWKAASELVTNWTSEDEPFYREGFARAWARAMDWMESTAKISPSYEALTLVVAQRDALLARANLPAVVLAANESAIADSGWEAYVAHVRVPPAERDSLHVLYLSMFATEYRKVRGEAASVAN